MSLRLVVTLFLLNSIVLFSQESTKKHTIVKGETISSIAEKYDVKQSEIYKLNPKAKNLLKLNSVLLIPVTTPKNTNTAVNKVKFALRADIYLNRNHYRVRFCKNAEMSFRAIPGFIIYYSF